MMSMALELSPEQRDLVDIPATCRLWLSGPAGTGKTTTAVRRLGALLAQGVAADQLLVLVPQRTLGLPYHKAIRHPDAADGALVDVLTPGGLARRMVALFWPLAAEAAGFKRPDRPPTFLTLETAQYYMAHIVRPLMLEERYFDSVTLERNRVYSQVLDNLNKATVVGFSHTEVGQRLAAAWSGEESRLNVYRDIQECVNRFRAYCLAHNLLDFSLQLEVFATHLWPHPTCRDHLIQRYRHLIVDNAEEFTPRDHDLLCQWLPQADSALVVYDEDAGYRVFLGADPQTAQAIRAACNRHEALTASFVTSPGIEALEKQLCDVLERPSQASAYGDPRNALRFAYHRFHPQMIDWVAQRVACLIHEDHTPPNEIVILAPFLSDALRFALRNRLEAANVPVHSHRPSRTMQEEPATRCLLTWASLAHPDWGFTPSPVDVAHALQQSMADTDLVRAQLLAETLYRPTDLQLQSFDQLKHAMQKRVTYLLGGRYEGLRIWLNDYRSRKPEPLDHFLRRLFGEVLSQVGYGFHRNFDAAKVAANLIESVQKFRWATEAHPLEADVPLGKAYLQLVQDGVIAAQYVQSWAMQTDDAVLLAPAYTFLLANRPVDHQFWLNVSSPGWWERIDQPLTHPYVLGRHWARGARWTDADEVKASQDTLHRLLVGLLRRCRKRVYLGLSELDEQGLEQRGPLLSALQQVLRILIQEED